MNINSFGYLYNPLPVGILAINWIIPFYQINHGTVLEIHNPVLI